MFSTLYAEHYDLLNRDKQYKKEVEFVYKWAGEPSSILDLGCGNAHYWKYWPCMVEKMGIEQSAHMREESPYKGRIICDKVGPESIETALRFREWDAVTALFEVMNYIPDHSWWPLLPLKSGGHFIFDVWDKKKAQKDGFRTTFKRMGSVSRTITPLEVTKNKVDLELELTIDGVSQREVHTMHLYSDKDIRGFAADFFEVDGVVETERWQTWYRLRKK